MHIVTSLAIAGKGLLLHKRQTFFTMLGIVIGIFAVVLVMSVGAGAQSLIVDQIAQRGTDQIAVLAGASDESGPPAQALGVVITTLTEEDGEALLNPNNVRYAEAVAAYVSGNDVLVWQGNERSVTYTGTSASYETVENVELAEGAFFTEEDENSEQRVMVLGSSIAEEIFGDRSPIGERVRLQRRAFTVVGVLKPKGSNPFEDADNAVLIPLSVAQKQLLGIGHVSFLRIKVKDESVVPQSVEEIRQTLLERHEDEDFSVRNISDALSIITTITDAIRLFLIAIAAVALFVGGVGVMNIMLIAVKEKTREIGVRKAVGARDRDILDQFLVETLLIVFVGTAIGFVLGTGVAYGVALIVRSLGYHYDFSLSLTTVLVAALIALLIGLIFGFAPARRAARLNPIEALRYE